MILDPTFYNKWDLWRRNFPIDNPKLKKPSKNGEKSEKKGFK